MSMVSWMLQVVVPVPAFQLMVPSTVTVTLVVVAPV